MLLIRILLIIGMALYSFNAYPEIRIIKKGIQPVKPKKQKESKSKKALERESEQEREHECEKEIKLCEANNVKP
jgi:hypothetical protein